MNTRSRMSACMAGPKRCIARACTFVLAWLLCGGAAHAATTIRLQLDWYLEGPSAFFTLPLDKGYFKQAGLDVTLQTGSGSADAVNRVASGSADIGFADLATVMEFRANHPDAADPPIAVMMVYNNTPAAVFALKTSGIRKPRDLAGKRLGAPAFDAGRRIFPIFQKVNRIGSVQWTGMDPNLREAMLIRGDVDAITGYYFTSMLNLEARGVRPADVVVMPYSVLGVKLYGNAIITSTSFLKRNPDALRGFLKAFARGAKEVLADPAAAVMTLRDRDSGINAELEERRLRLTIQSSVATPDARAEGFGRTTSPRLAVMASQVADAFETRSRVDPTTVFDERFLPTPSELDIFGK